MTKRQFGKSGLVVTPISLGTVALGTEYGIEALAGGALPPEENAIQVIRYAISQGINLLDTAPNYGDSERRVGLATEGKNDVFVATKVSLLYDSHGKLKRGPVARETMERSIETSRRMLKRSCLDILQVHNATVEAVSDPFFLGLMSQAKSKGCVRSLGVSVYGTAPALSAIETGMFDMVQVAFNILDASMIHEVFPQAQKKKVALLVRSAFLKGALTEKVLELPPHLEPLKNAVLGLKEEMKISWEELPILALRYCLSFSAVNSVLVGARTTAEIDDAVKAVRLGKLTPDEVKRLQQFALDDPKMTNPSNWGIR